MTLQERVFLWLADYCSAKKYAAGFNVIVTLAKDKSIDIVQKINTTRLGTLLLYDAVNTKFDISNFYAVITTASEIYDSLPKDAVPFKLFAKVTTGLKILVIFDMLKTGSKFVLPRLNEFFPRTGINHPKADKSLAAKLSAAQLKFRRFLLQMIANKTQREAYFRDEYSQEYGQEFREKVKDLVQQFIFAVDNQLPATIIERLFSVARTDFEQHLLRLRSPVLNLMLDMGEKEYLTEKDVIDIAEALVADSEVEPNLSRISKVSSSKIHSAICEPGNASTDDQSPTQIQKMATVDVYSCSFENNPHPSYELFSSGDMRDVGMSTELGKTQVPLGKVYRMNYRQTKQTKSIARISLQEKADSVYKSIQREVQQGHNKTVALKSASSHRKKSRKRSRSFSPEGCVSTSEAAREPKKTRQQLPIEYLRGKPASVLEKSTEKLSQGYFDPIQDRVDPSPEQVYTISSSSGCEESRTTVENTPHESIQDSSQIHAIQALTAVDSQTEPVEVSAQKYSGGTGQNSNSSINEDQNASCSRISSHVVSLAKGNSSRISCKLTPCIMEKYVKLANSLQNKEETMSEDISEGLSHKCSGENHGVFSPRSDRPVFDSSKSASLGMCVELPDSHLNGANQLLLGNSSQSVHSQGNTPSIISDRSWEKDLPKNCKGRKSVHHTIIGDSVHNTSKTLDVQKKSLMYDEDNVVRALFTKEQIENSIHQNVVSGANCFSNFSKACSFSGAAQDNLTGPVKNTSHLDRKLSQSLVCGDKMDDSETSGIMSSIPSTTPEKKLKPSVPGKLQGKHAFLDEVDINITGLSSLKDHDILNCADSQTSPIETRPHAVNQQTSPLATTVLGVETPPLVVSQETSPPANLGLALKTPPSAVNRQTSPPGYVGLARETPPPAVIQRTLSLASLGFAIVKPPPAVNQQTSPELGSQNSETSFYSCVTSPQEQTFSQEVISTPYVSALELPDTGDGHPDLVNMTLVQDSDDDNIDMTNVDLTIIPSSNSVDKYDTVLEITKEALPQLQKHLRHHSAKMCVLKLFRNEELDQVIGNIKYDVYS